MRTMPFSRRSDRHPAWCGQGHVCSNDRPGGEHRSHPVIVDTETTRLVATRARTQTGRDRIEVRVVVDLPTHAGQAMARRFILRLHQLLATTRPGDTR